MTEPTFMCEALGCERPADWAYIGESGDMFLCDFHGGAGAVDGWTRIERGTVRAMTNTPTEPTTPEPEPADDPKLTPEEQEAERDRRRREERQQ